jgi:hypothetical protein
LKGIFLNGSNAAYEDLFRIIISKLKLKILGRLPSKKQHLMILSSKLR